MVSLGILILVVVLILTTSLKGRRDIGAIGAFLIIAVTVWRRGDGLVSLGFFPPDNWRMVILWSILFGTAIQFLSTLILEPFSDKITKSTTDHSSFDGLRGNLGYFLLILVSVWVVVVFLEEIIFRGYMMGEIARLIGTSKAALAVNVILSSVLFGLAHWYQGRSGALSTGIIGALLGILFITSGFNLWLPILTHGFIDTIGLFLVYLNADKFLKERVKIFG
jgi:membrane protease YdiL (CAAX protease family)